MTPYDARSCRLQKFREENINSKKYNLTMYLTSLHTMPINYVIVICTYILPRYSTISCDFLLFVQYPSFQHSFPSPLLLPVAKTTISVYGYHRGKPKLTLPVLDSSSQFQIVFPRDLIRIISYRSSFTIGENLN